MVAVGGIVLARYVPTRSLSISYLISFRRLIHQIMQIQFILELLSSFLHQKDLPNFLFPPSCISILESKDAFPNVSYEYFVCLR